MKSSFSNALYAAPFIILLLTLGLARTSVAQTNYYVATTGNDSTGNGSMASPWATIAHASTKVGPGATVNVAAGVYNGSFNTTASGTASAYITYVANTANFSGPVNCAQIAAGQGNLATCPRIVGVSSSTWVNSGNYVAIKGFDVTGPGINGIYTEGNATIVSGNHVHNILTATCNSTGGSGININGTNAQVTGNYVHNIGPFPTACGYVQGIYFLQAGGFAENNISFANSGFGIQLWHYPAHVSLINNTLFNNASGGLVLGTDDAFTVDYIYVANNLISNNGGEGISEQGGSSNSTGIHNIYTNNLVYGNAGGSISLMNGLTASSTVTGAPQFVNYTGTATGNYHLTSTSPAIKAAANTAPATDFDGVARPQNGGYDIGAYQYVGGSTPPPAEPVVTLSSSLLSFATTSVDSTSAVGLVTLTNTGTVPLTFTRNFVVSGPFAFGGKGTCAMTVAAQASCTISAVFKPTATGASAGAVTLTDNAGSGTQVLTLSGTGK
jgi:hypothetical protein